MLERGMRAELTEHLGYEKHESADAAQDTATGLTNTSRPRPPEAPPSPASPTSHLEMRAAEIHEALLWVRRKALQSSVEAFVTLPRLNALWFVKER